MLVQIRLLSLLFVAMVISPMSTLAANSNAPSRVSPTQQDSHAFHVRQNKVNSRSAIEKRSQQYVTQFADLQNQLKPYTTQIRSHIESLKTCPEKERHSHGEAIHKHIDSCRQVIQECGAHSSHPSSPKPSGYPSWPPAPTYPSCSVLAAIFTEIIIDLHSTCTAISWVVGSISEWKESIGSSITDLDDNLNLLLTGANEHVEGLTQKCSTFTGSYRNSWSHSSIYGRRTQDYSYSKSLHFPQCFSTLGTPFYGW